MFCSKCGTQLGNDAAFCTNCGQAVQRAEVPTQPAPSAVAPQTSAAPPPIAAPSVGPAPAAYTPTVTPPQHPGYGYQATQVTRSQTGYAGFWLRLVAYIFDAMILGVVGIGAFFPLFRANMHAFSSGNVWELYTSPSRPLFAMRMLALMLSWVYYASLESSMWQATLGKKILGLKVTDLAGNRITFGRASGRFFGKILSGMILGIGFLMAGFTERKQALHDILAGCLVLRQL
jgi:uncharacterized RDD family membrane protein YckC